MDGDGDGDKGVNYSFLFNGVWGLPAGLYREQGRELTLAMDSLLESVGDPSVEGATTASGQLLRALIVFYARSGDALRSCVFHELHRSQGRGLSRQVHVALAVALAGTKTKAETETKTGTGMGVILGETPLVTSSLLDNLLSDIVDRGWVDPRCATICISYLMAKSNWTRGARLAIAFPGACAGPRMTLLLTELLTARPAPLTALAARVVAVSTSYWTFVSRCPPRDPALIHFLLALLVNDSALSHRVPVFLKNLPIDPDPTVYHLVIRYHLRQSNPDAAHSILRVCLERTSVPPSKIFNEFLEFYVASNNQPRVADILALMQTHDVKPDELAMTLLFENSPSIDLADFPFLFSTIFSQRASTRLMTIGISKGILLQTLITLIHTNGTFNIASHTFIMQQYLALNKPQSAIDWFNKQSLPASDSLLRGCLVECYAALDNTAKALELMKETGSPQDLFLKLIDGLMRCKAAESVRAFCKSVNVEPNIRIAMVHRFLVILGRSGESKILVDSFCDLFGFKISLNGIERELGSSDMTTSTKTIGLLLSYVENPSNVFDYFFPSHMTPTRVEFLVLITLLSRSGKIPQALKALSKMIDYGIKPDAKHINVILSNLHQSFPSSGPEVESLETSLTAHLDSLSTDTIISILNTRAKLGDMSGFMAWWAKLTSPPIEAYSLRIECTARQSPRNSSSATSLNLILTEMADAGVPLNRVALLNCMEACSNRWAPSQFVDVGQAEEHFQLFLGLGPMTSVDFRGVVCMLDIYARGGSASQFWNFWPKAWKFIFRDSAVLDMDRFTVEVKDKSALKTLLLPDTLNAFWAVTLDAVYRIDGLEKGRQTWTLFVKAISKAGGFPLNEGVYSSHVEGLSKFAQYSEVLEVLQDMRQSRVQIGQKVLLGILGPLSRDMAISRDDAARLEHGIRQIAVGK